jgi:hypothetical protein
MLSWGAIALTGGNREEAKREVSRTDRRPDTIDVNAERLSSLITRVAGTSEQEIDNLIAELQAVRNFLKAEGERVQRELTSYAQAAQAALSSVELISEALVRERHAAQLFDGVRRLPPPANEPEGG